MSETSIIITTVTVNILNEKLQKCIEREEKMSCALAPLLNVDTMSSTAEKQWPQMVHHVEFIACVKFICNTFSSLVEKVHILYEQAGYEGQNLAEYVAIANEMNATGIPSQCKNRSCGGRDPLVAEVQNTAVFHLEQFSCLVGTLNPILRDLQHFYSAKILPFVDQSNVDVFSNALYIFGICNTVDAVESVVSLSTITVAIRMEIDMLSEIFEYTAFTISRMQNVALETTTTTVEMYDTTECDFLI
jgi:hypothetical protein